jgi:hypothetical protein
MNITNNPTDLPAHIIAWAYTVLYGLAIIVYICFNAPSTLNHDGQIRVPCRHFLCGEFHKMKDTCPFCRDSRCQRISDDAP